MPAGYSGTPLVKKLGIKPGARVAFVGDPPHFATLVGPLPDGVTRLSRPGKDMDYLHVFSTRKADLEKRFRKWMQRLAPDGALWVSWPKKTSSIESDLSGDVVRATGLAAGLVDIKVCAVDDDWSGLKFVYRVADRRR